MDHNPEVYYVSAESAKKWTLIIVSVQFFDFFSFKVIFRHFRPLGGSLGARWYPWGPPRAPMRSLTSIATLTPCLVLPPVQLGKFADFWGLPPYHLYFKYFCLSLSSESLSNFLTKPINRWLGWGILFNITVALGKSYFAREPAFMKSVHTFDILCLTRGRGACVESFSE